MPLTKFDILLNKLNEFKCSNLEIYKQAFFTGANEDKLF